MVSLGLCDSFEQAEQRPLNPYELRALLPIAVTSASLRHVCAPLPEQRMSDLLRRNVCTKRKAFWVKPAKKNCNKLFLLFLVKGYDKPKHHVSYRLLICKRPCTRTNYISNIKASSYITQSLWGLPGQHSDSSKSQINSLTQSDVTVWCFRQVKRSVSVGEKVTGTCEPPEQWWFSFTVQLPPSARGNILAISSPPFLSQPPTAANYLEYHFSLTSISCPRGSWSYWCTKWMDCHGNWNCTWREILLIFFAVDGPINPGYFMQKKPELWQLGLQLTAVFVIGWSLHLFSL